MLVRSGSAFWSRILDKIELKLYVAVRVGVEAENKARAESKTTIKAETKLIGDRPAGRTPDSNPLVQAALWAATATGHKPTLTLASTDSNLPISLGIPAVTMGSGGKGGDAHSRAEWFEPENSWKGPQAVLLTILQFDSSLR